MADPLAALQHLRYIRVDHVQVGDTVRRYGHDWIIQERMPVFYEGGFILIGHDPQTHQRAALLYDNESDVAVVIT